MNGKIALFLVVMSAITLSCTSNGKDNNTLEERISKRYIATDGTSTMVFFGKKEGKKYVEIQNNGKNIRIHQQPSDDSLQYSEHGIVVFHRGDSLIIEQDNSVIELRRPKG